MVDYTQIEISTNLKEQLQNMATEKNTDIDNVIKLALVENTQLKKKPDNFMDTSKVSSKANKDKDGNIKSYSFSTAIPKPILNKLGLTKGQVLYWDIDEYKIIITPEVTPVPVPEEESIGAGFEILNNFLFKNNTSYSGLCTNILVELQKDGTPEDKAKELVKRYKATDNKDSYKQLVLYLLDYPTSPENHEILQNVYDEITK